MSDAHTSIRRRDLLLGMLLCAVLGAVVASWLHWPALTDPLIYKSDVRQSPHWAAYTHDSFRDDDMLVAYATFNESPLQNAIYWVGTRFSDYIWVGKLVCVAGFAMYGVVFFLVGALMFNFRVGILMAVSVLLFPDQFDYVAGGFSKMWMIPLLVVAVFLIERRTWKGLWLLMPFAALAYPVSAVLIGAAAGVGALLEYYRDKSRVLPALRDVAVGGVLGVIPLLFKYWNPPDFIGPATPISEMKRLPAMYHDGLSPYLPTPSPLDTFWDHVNNPFILGGAFVFLVVLRKKIVFRPSWLALGIASFALYFLAEVFFMRLYVPNRYLRYSMGALLPLWQACNLDLILQRVPSKVAQGIILTACVVLAGFAFQDKLEVGKDTGKRHHRAPLSEFFATQPEKILISGHPWDMNDIPVLARRSVLMNQKLHHSWFVGYRDEMDRRVRATFRALFARDVADVNQLHERYGVDYLVVTRRYLAGNRVLTGNAYLEPYDDYLRELSRGDAPPMFLNFPSHLKIWSERGRFVVRLPLPETLPGEDR